VRCAESLSRITNSFEMANRRSGIAEMEPSVRSWIFLRPEWDIPTCSILLIRQRAGEAKSREPADLSLASCIKLRFCLKL
jgi:hypothetical protein